MALPIAHRRYNSNNLCAQTAALDLRTNILDYVNKCPSAARTTTISAMKHLPGRVDG